MQRREFIRLFGGVAAAWSLEASAQQPERMRRVGMLMGITESDPAQQSFVSAFTKALQDLGWHAGRNVRIDYRWGAGDADKIQSFAREFVEQKPDLIVGHTTPVVAALEQQTSTIPIVFTQVSDPIGSHFVDGLAHPGGNITGFTNLEASIGAKLMELLKEVAPPKCSVSICPCQSSSAPMR
jgi:putative ABC transport system substrate-binding protein